MNNAQEFINSFVAIEMHLRELVGTAYMPFHQLVSEAGKINALILHYALDLTEFAQLRNAITHTRTGESKIIAEPHDDVVLEIKNILEALTNQKTIIEVFDTKVYRADVNDNLQEVLGIKDDHHYSVVPIYRGKSYIGIIHDALFARCVETNKGKVNLETIEELLLFQRSNDRVVFMAQDASLVDVLATFNKQQTKGTRLIALIITERGHMNEEPLSIITLADLPKVISNLNK